MDILRKAGISFSVTPGNHDIGTGGSADMRDTPAFNDAFSIGYTSQDPAFGGVYAAEPERFDNTFMLWTAPNGSLSAWNSGRATTFCTGPIRS